MPLPAASGRAAQLSGSKHPAEPQTGPASSRAVLFPHSPLAAFHLAEPGGVEALQDLF